MDAASKIAQKATAGDIFSTWLAAFGRAIEDSDAVAFGRSFAADGFWRDRLAFSWERPTFSGATEIREAFRAVEATVGAHDFRIAAERTAPRFASRSGSQVVEGWFEFDLAVGRGAGFARLLPGSKCGDEVTARLVLTTLLELRGFEEATHRHRPTGDKYVHIQSPLNWRQIREHEQAHAERYPEVVIVGAGQGGLMLAAHLRQIGVDALLIDKADRVGDSWRNRYNVLTIHNNLSANHFPYLPFPATWPTWLPKDMLADWLESYAAFMELNVWTGVTLTAASYDEADGGWRINIAGHGAIERTMRCKHLVIATGVTGGRPKRPDIPGLDDFVGAVLHSGTFNSGLDWAGKRVVVIGAGNSGLDIAQDLHISGADHVSVMQRGPTCVLSLEPSAAIIYAIYDEGIPVEDIDLMVEALPHDLLIDSYQWITRKTTRLDRDMLNRLEAVGFKTYLGEDESGFQILYLRRAGGYYIDVGCCQLIAEKKIDVLHAEAMDRVVSEGVRMRDGSIVPCELIVTATGFESMSETIRRLLGDRVADRVGPVWGFDDDHHMRNMWTRTAQDGLWLMGGAIPEARMNSPFLALQIKAQLEGLLPDRADLPLVELRRKKELASATPARPGTEPARKG